MAGSSSLANKNINSGTPRGRNTSDTGNLTAMQAFLSVIEPVLITNGAKFNFPGAVLNEHAEKVWTWVNRDVLPDTAKKIDAALASGAPARIAVEPEIVRVLASIKAELSSAAKSVADDRRITVQMGGDEVRTSLPIILNALKYRALIEKARAFGKAANAIQDEAAIGTALQSMPIKDRALSALLFQAFMGQVANPSRIITGILPLCGVAREDSVISAGFGPLVEAFLAHANAQLARFGNEFGQFNDVDLACRALDRMHRLLRAITGNLELERAERWSRVVSEITKTASAKLEPRLRQISADVSQSLRKSRDGTDRLDADLLLEGLNGLFLLSSVREARDSLALNALFDQLWTEVGQSLEILLARNLDDFKSDHRNQIIAQRLDYGIKMSEIRFGAEYATAMRHAYETVLKRQAG